MVQFLLTLEGSSNDMGSLKIIIFVEIKKKILGEGQESHLGSGLRLCL